MDVSTLFAAPNTAASTAALSFGALAGNGGNAVAPGDGLEAVDSFNRLLDNFLSLTAGGLATGAMGEGEAPVATDGTVMGLTVPQGTAALAGSGLLKMAGALNSAMGNGNGLTARPMEGRWAQSGLNLLAGGALAGQEMDQEVIAFLNDLSRVISADGGLASPADGDERSVDGSGVEEIDVTGTLVVATTEGDIPTPAAAPVIPLTLSGPPSGLLGMTLTTAGTGLTSLPTGQTQGDIATPAPPPVIPRLTTTATPLSGNAMPAPRMSQTATTSEGLDTIKASAPEAMSAPPSMPSVAAPAAPAAAIASETTDGDGMAHAAPAGPAGTAPVDLSADSVTGTGARAAAAAATAPDQKGAIALPADLVDAAGTDDGQGMPAVIAGNKTTPSPSPIAAQTPSPAVSPTPTATSAPAPAVGSAAEPGPVAGPKPMVTQPRTETAPTVTDATPAPLVVKAAPAKTAAPAHPPAQTTETVSVESGDDTPSPDTVNQSGSQTPAPHLTGSATRPSPAKPAVSHAAGRNPLPTPSADGQVTQEAEPSPAEDAEKTNQRMLAPSHVGNDARTEPQSDIAGPAQNAGQNPTGNRPDATPPAVNGEREDNLLSRAVTAAGKSAGNPASDGSTGEDAGTAPTTDISDSMTGAGTVTDTVKAQGSDFAQSLRQTTAPHRPGAYMPPTHQMAMHVQRAVQEGNERLSIRLNPQELGRIDVQLEIGSEGKLRAKVMAENPQTLEMLQKDSKTLEKALQDAGLQTDQHSLSFSLQDSGDQARERQDQRGQPNHGTPLASNDDEYEDPAILAQTQILELGRVDVRV